MTTNRLALGLAAIAALAAAWTVRDRRRRTPPHAPTARDLGWDLADDIKQAVANSLPHESGAFNAPRPSSG
jgi:hypothetical protein